jgi:hypothetical protein
MGFLMFNCQSTSAGHLKYWRYGKTREFRVKLNFAPKNSRTFYPQLSRFTVSSIFQMTSTCPNWQLNIKNPRENNIYREGISQFPDR